MKPISLCNTNTVGTSQAQLLFFNTVEKKNSQSFLTSTCYCPYISSASKFKPSISSPSSSSSFRVSCSYNSGKNGDSDDETLTTSWAYGVLGLDPQCSSTQLKAAFRTKVKQFHPDVTRGGQNSDIMIRRVIQAYEILSNYSKSEIIERECMDPFDQPECEAYDIFVNGVLCIGRDAIGVRAENFLGFREVKAIREDCPPGCPYSCVNMAPHAFKFSSVTGTARAASQGNGNDYQVRLAVGQCPRSCIHYVTPSQRIILEELLDSILNMPFDTSAEAELLYSLIVKANYENNRYQKPKKNAKVSTKHVDWF